MDLRGPALERLARYRWPGNLRELKNAMEYAAATGHGDSVAPDALPQKLSIGPAPASGATPAPAGAATQFRDIQDEIRDLERARMQAAMDAVGGNQTRAAELINMPLRTFVTKVKQYALSGPRQ